MALNSTGSGIHSSTLLYLKFLKLLNLLCVSAAATWLISQDTQGVSFTHSENKFRLYRSIRFRHCFASVWTSPNFTTLYLKKISARGGWPFKTGGPGKETPPSIKFKLFYPRGKKLMILDPRRQLSLHTSVYIYRLNCWRVYIFLFLFDHSLYLVCARSAVGRGKVILALSSFSSSFPYCFYHSVFFSFFFLGILILLHPITDI